MKKHILLLSLLILNIILSPAFAFAQDDDLSLLQVENSPEDIKMASEYKTRKSLLEWHNYTGYAAAALYLTSMITAPDENKRSTRHNTLAIAAGTTYLTSAALAWLAPKPKGTKLKNNMKWHVRAAWIHVPAMILTGLSGYLADKHRKDGEEVKGFGGAHKAFSTITAISLAASITLLHYEF